MLLCSMYIIVHRELEQINICFKTMSIHEYLIKYLDSLFKREKLCCINYPFCGILYKSGHEIDYLSTYLLTVERKRTDKRFFKLY